MSVRDTYHFAYADGTPHFSFGTTAYAWTHQGDELEEKTLATLKKAPFNKMRMCIFPKDYPYQHLRSIHHAKVMYDHSKPWVTHVSLQDDDFKAKALTFRDQYKKPLVYDECRYEGNLSHHWGNISAEEMVHRFWHGMTRGAYVGHGETYLDPKDHVMLASQLAVKMGESLGQPSLTNARDGLDRTD